MIVLAAFDNLSALPETDSPKFVFSHIVALHGPTYLFGPDGEPRGADVPYTLLEDSNTPPTGRDKYRDQAVFVSKRVKETVQAILESSETPPVIILQADHGSNEVPGTPQHVAIFNAILVRPECRDLLYPTMTPVNTFRVVFNCYFDAGLPIVRDEVFWSNWPRYADYEFHPVVDELD